jgi:hypothetical protein
MAFDRIVVIAAMVCQIFQIIDESLTIAEREFGFC